MFHHVYILLDAVDESHWDGPRKDVLRALEAMRNRGLQGLHLFTTSPDEPDIGDSLDISATQQVTMQNVGIDKDIADSITSGVEERPFRLRPKASVSLEYPSRWERCCQSIFWDHGNPQTKYRATNHAAVQKSRLGAEESPSEDVRYQDRSQEHSKNRIAIRRTV